MLETGASAEFANDLRNTVACMVLKTRPDLALELMANTPAEQRNEFLKSQLHYLDLAVDMWWPSPERDEPPPDRQALRTRLEQALGEAAPPPSGSLPSEAGGASLSP
jgi:hypothetical protein